MNAPVNSQEIQDGASRPSPVASTVPDLTALIPALVAAQAMFGRAARDATNTHFGSSYVTLSAVLAAVMPALSANGLALVQTTDTDAAGVLVLRTTLYHTSGQSLSTSYPILPVQATPQGYGSALTYARRYSVLALCGIAPASDDDDGNAASQGPRTHPNGPMRAPIRKPLQGKGSALPSIEGKVSRPTTLPPDANLEEVAEQVADAIDRAPSIAALLKLADTVGQVPEDMRPPLRQRYADRRAYLRGKEADAAGIRIELDNP